MTMKILIFNTLYSPNFQGGAEKSVQILAETLSKAGIQVEVCTTSNRNEMKTLNGVKITYVKVKNLYWLYGKSKKNPILKALWHLIDSLNVFSSYQIARIVKKSNPDVIHTNNLAGFSVNVWKIARNMKIPIVHTLRDYYLSCPRSTRYKNNTICKKSCFDCSLYSIPKKKLSNDVGTVV
ncbi:MAG: glycosyltransferase involved in cell wall biosynthesis, partial [Paraglaciecola sp.]